MINRNTSRLRVCQEFLDPAVQSKATLELLCFLFSRSLHFSRLAWRRKSTAWRVLERPDTPTLCSDLLRSDRAVYRRADRKEGMIVKRMKKLNITGWELESFTAGERLMVFWHPPPSLLRSEIITTIYKHFTSAALARLPGIFHCPSLLTAGCQDSNQGRKLQDDKPGRDPPSLSLFLAR